MHQHIQLRQALDASEHCFGIRQVNANGFNVMPLRAQPGSHGFSLFKQAVGNHHPRAAFGKGLDDAQANALGAACDQHELAAEIQVIRHGQAPNA